MNVSDENFPTDLILEYENNLFLRCCKIDYVNYISTSGMKLTISNFS